MKVTSVAEKKEGMTMKKSLFIVFALILISVAGTSIYGFAADKENTVAEQAAKPVQEDSQDMTAEGSETLNEEAAIPTTYSAVVTDEVARGGDEIRTEPKETVEAPSTTVVAVEPPAEEPVITVDVPPAQELNVEVPDDWDAYLNGDTAPVAEASIE